jgi:hypothetical protein
MPRPTSKQHFFYSDDPAEEDVETTGNGLLRKVVAVVLIFIVSFGVKNTFAANVSLGSQSIEFGQGILLSSACDPSVILTPITSFINDYTYTPNGSKSGTAGTTSLVVNYGQGGPYSNGMRVSGVGIQPETYITNAPIGGTWNTLTISKPLLSNVSTFDLTAPAGFYMDGFSVSNIDTSINGCKGKSFLIRTYGEPGATNRLGESILETTGVIHNGTTFVANGSYNSQVSGVSSTGFTVKYCLDNDYFCRMAVGWARWNVAASTSTRFTVETS